MTFFAMVQVFVMATAISFCVVGAYASRSRRRRETRRAQAHREAATIVLDAGPDLEAASQELAGLPSDLLAEVLQQLIADTTGEARRRLRVVAQHAGLTRRVERMVERRSWRRRVHGAHLLMLLPDGAPQREVMLRDPHPYVRARAIESLGPSEVDDFASALIDSLAHDNPAVWSAAQHALTRGGTGSVPALTEALDRGERQLMSADATALAVEVAVENPDPRLAERLTRLIGHPSVRIRRLVAGFLGTGSVIDVDDSLLALLNDEDASVRAAAAHSVGAARAIVFAPHLGRLLADQHWQVRREAGAALGHLGSVGRVVLRCHLSDDDSFARDMALHTLVQIGEVEPDVLDDTVDRAA